MPSLAADYLSALSPGDDIHLSMMSDAATILVALRSKPSRSAP